MSVALDQQRPNTSTYESFFDQGPFGIVVLDSSFRIRSLNRAAENWMVENKKAWEGQLIFDFLTHEDGKILQSLLNHIDVFRQPLDLQLSMQVRLKVAVPFRAFLWKKTSAEGLVQYCLLISDPLNPLRKQQFNKDMYKAIIESQEQERKLIGDLLHDSVAQLLYAVRLNLQHFMLHNPDGENLVPTKKLLNQAIDQVRDISKSLVPSVLNDFGLKAGILDFSDRLSLPGFEVSARVEDDCEHIHFEFKLALYRMTQELLNNCMKHSGASKVWITLMRKSDKLYLVVEDNGKGFYKKVADCVKEGTGLRNIKSRLAHLNGNLRIKSTAQGTRVNIHIPLIA